MADDITLPGSGAVIETDEQVGGEHRQVVSVGEIRSGGDLVETVGTDQAVRVHPVTADGSPAAAQGLIWATETIPTSSLGSDYDTDEQMGPVITWTLPSQGEVVGVHITGGWDSGPKLALRLHTTAPFTTDSYPLTDDYHTTWISTWEDTSGATPSIGVVAPEAGIAAVPATVYGVLMSRQDGQGIIGDIEITLVVRP